MSRTCNLCIFFIYNNIFFFLYFDRLRHIRLIALITIISTYTEYLKIQKQKNILLFFKMDIVKNVVNSILINGLNGVNRA